MTDSRRRRSPRRVALALLGTLALAALVAGCGGSSGGTASSKSGTGDGGGGNAGTVEGTITVAGGKVVVQPHTGATQTFAVTADTEPTPGELQAIAASHEPARVQYRGGDALVITKKSDALKELRQAQGTLTAVSVGKRTLSIRADDGTKTAFVVDTADVQAMDLPHLHDDHLPQHSKVVVYYDTKAGTNHARGFEDL